MLLLGDSPALATRATVTHAPRQVVVVNPKPPREVQALEEVRVMLCGVEIRDQRCGTRCRRRENRDQTAMALSSPPVDGIAPVNVEFRVCAIAHDPRDNLTRVSLRLRPVRKSSARLDRRHRPEATSLWTGSEHQSPLVRFFGRCIEFTGGNLRRREAGP